MSNQVRSIEASPWMVSSVSSIKSEQKLSHHEGLAAIQDVPSIGGGIPRVPERVHQRCGAAQLGMVDW